MPKKIVIEPEIIHRSSAEIARNPPKLIIKK
jgi:hypothetical protein